MNNYIELKKGLPSRCRHFVFLDSKECSAAKVFFRLKLPVKVKETWVRDGERYHFAVCDVTKKRCSEFLKAMDCLKQDMQILGYTDYDDACERLFGELLDGIES